MTRLRLNVPLVLAVLLLLGFVALLVLPSVADLRSPDDETLQLEIDGQRQWAPFQAGEGDFLLGTDRAGRDVFSRLVHGARYSLTLAAGVTLARAAISIPLGLLAGWFGGWLYRFVQAATIGFSAIPNLLLFVIIVAALRTMFSVNLPYWALLMLLGLPRLTSLVADQTRAAALHDHIEAARAVGARLWRILLRHVLPVIRGDLLIGLAAEASLVLVAMGQLAILSVTYGGSHLVQGQYNLIIVEKLPEWAQMMAVNRSDIRVVPWVVIGPAICLGLAASSFQLLAEGLRRRLQRVPGR